MRSTDTLHREYSLNGDHCYREVPTVIAVPIQYNSSTDSFDVLGDETSVLVSATLAVHTIQALFQTDDMDVLGLTYDEEIRDEPKEEGLTMSERVGIGVGSAIFGLLVIGLGAFLYFRRRAKKNSRRYPPHEMEAVGGTVTLTSGDGVMIAPHPSRSPYGGATNLRNSMADTDSRDDEYDVEIEVLRAQKAAIQRRIEELETVETPVDETGAGKKI